MQTTKKGKWLGLVLSISLASIAFVGCSKSTDVETSAAPGATVAATTEATTAATTAASAAPEVSKAPELTPMTYSINTGDNKLTWDNPISKILTEKTGITLKYDLTAGDEKPRWDIWLAAGDYPDIVSLDPEHIKKYKDAGAIIPLNELIEQYGPNIKAKFGEYFNLLKGPDGIIDSIYNVNLNKEASADSTANFIVQYDVLKEAGYPVIKTFDQLYTIISDYVKKHPKIDGKDTIGFTGAMNGWVNKIQFNNPITFSAGRPDEGNFQINDGKVTFNPVSADAKNYYGFLNKLYTNGLYDKEAFSLDGDNMKAKMAQGRVLAAFAPNWLLGDTEKSLRAAGKPERQYAKLPIYSSETIVDHNNTIVPTGAGTGHWAITKNAKNPERIIQFIDYLFSDEAQILTHWGIEGVDYKIVDGKRTETPEKIAKVMTDPDYWYKEGLKSEASGTSSGWFSIGNGAKLADGDYATPVTNESVLANYDQATKDILAKYGKKVWAEFLPPVEVVPGYLWQLTPPDSTKVPNQKIEAQWFKDLPKIIMAKTQADFDKNWNSMVEAMGKQGLTQYEADMTKLWADFNANFTKSLGQ
ncbi:extracellular solute-binding protein [Paenibacillus psychroresistens]|nr:extracellular solute-binding protein [Paenibacillus psychroresistens]